ncbi:MAG: putative Ig domain-containing protein, partial [Candidatus Magnetomorum sp.]|nr:putative Ig domain-containing protein [Candidatus Magnetomorum sp.]
KIEPENEPDKATIQGLFSIISPNDPPTVANNIQDQSINEDEDLNFTFNADSFDDVDIIVGDSLSYIATLNNGNALPSWLHFNAQTRNFSGTPTNDDVGAITIKLIAYDSSSLSAHDSFNLIVIPVNDPPVVSDILDQTIPESSAFTAIKLDDFITDIDNENSSISWTAIGQQNLIITITNRIATIEKPHENWSGTETISFIAKDPGGLTDSDKAIFEVIPKPIIINLSDDLTPTKSKTWHWESDTSCTFRFEINQDSEWMPTGDFQTIQTATKDNADGTWYLHVQAKDQIGNFSDVVSVFAILDNTRPVITGINDEPIPQKNKTWTWHVNENDCLFRYAIDQNNTWIPSGEYSDYTPVTKIGYGEWYIHVEAIDLAGNVSDVVSGSVQLLKPTIQFKTMFSEGDESISQITLELILSHIASETVSVAYATNNNSSLEHAAKDKDYLLSNDNPVVIQQGERKGYIEFTIMDDHIPENNEHCVIELHTPSHAIEIAEINQYTYTILDNDPAGISIVASDGSSDVSENGIQDNFTVVLDKEPADTFQLIINTDHQISTNPEYLVFTPENWNHVQNVNILAVDDDIYELAPHKGVISFSIKNEVPKYSELYINHISVNITDNEQKPTVMFVKRYFEDAESVSPVNLPLTLSHRANKDVIIEYINKDTSTASEDKDFILNSSWQTSINAFELEGSIEINVINDSISENNETIVLEIVNSGIASIGNKNSCKYWIMNDDYPGIIINGISDSIELLEGESFSYSIMLNSQPESLVTIHVSAKDESIVDIAQKELNFYPDTWNIIQYVSLTIVDDNDYNDGLKTKIIHQAYIDQVYKDLPPKEIEITVKENDPEPSPPVITINELTNEDMVTWHIESGGGNGTVSCERNDQIILCNLGTMKTNFPEGKHLIKVKEEISVGQWTQYAFFEIEKDMGMPCSQVYAPEGITAENMAFTITYLHEDKYQCQTYINSNCGTGSNHCPTLYDRGSGVREIQLWVQMPDSKEFTWIDSDTGDAIDGYFNYTATDEGIYRFYTRAIDNASNAEPEPLLQDITKIAETLYIKNFSGYAIIAVGSVSGQEGLESHTLTANTLYKQLVLRNFWPEHIKYFNPYNEKQPGETDYDDHGGTYDDAFKNVITQWAPEQIQKLSGPLYIILIDHGSPDIFHLTGTQPLSADQLNQYLQAVDYLETREETIIILGTCFSGSFIDNISANGRIIVSSAAENEPSYRGPKLNPGGVRDGGFFITSLFNELSKGNNLLDSFNTSVLRTESFTFNVATSNKAPFHDYALQHPLLDDNGDQHGSNFLPLNGDGYIAQSIILGHNDNQAVEILQTKIEPKQLSPDENTLSFEVTVNETENLDRVWIEVRKPDVSLEDMRLRNVTDDFGLQQSVELEEFELVPGSQKEIYAYTSDDFEVPGQYIMFFYLEDTDGVISGYKETVVYKSKENNQPPRPFNPIYPKMSNETEFSDVILEWERAIDPENDQISYTLILSTDTDTFKKERIFDTIYFVSLPKSWDQKDILWKVQAIDNYGNMKETPEWTFKIDNNQDNWGSIVYFQVHDMDTQMPVPHAKLNISSNDINMDLELNSNGLNINRFVQSGLFEIAVIADNYTPVNESIEIVSGEMQSFNFSLDFKSSLGDINRNGKCDIGDAVQCLQVLSGIDNISYYDPSALAGDVIELRDVIFILQDLSEIKQ